MASDPLVELEVIGEVPITIVVSIWFPGAGGFLKRIGDILGVKANFYVSVKLAFGITVSIGQDQYEGFADETGVTLELPITFEVGVAPTAGDYAQATARAWVQAKPTLEIRGAAQPGKWLRLGIKGQLTTGAEFGGKFFIFKGSKSFDGPKFE